MRSLLFVLLAIYSQTAAQENERLVPFAERDANVMNVAHLVDGAGNTFLLGYVYCYKAGPGIFIHGCPRGGVVVKLDPSGKLLWQHRDANFKPHYRSELHLVGDRLLAVGRLQDNNNACGYTPFPLQVPAVLNLNAETGALLARTAIPYDTPCRSHTPLGSALTDDGHLALLYANRSNHVWLDVQDRHLRRAHMTQADVQSDYNLALFFDEIRQAYLLVTTSGLTVLDTALQPVQTFELPSAPPYSDYFSSVAAASRTHYALCQPYRVESGSASGQDTTLATLTVWEASGRVLYHKPSEVFTQIHLTEGGRLWCMSRNAARLVAEGDLIDSSIHLVQMDLAGNRLREGIFGGPWILCSRFSLEGDSLTLTGTAQTDGGRRTDPDTPSRLWWRRMAMRNVPVVASARAPTCGDVFVSPNPAAGYLTLSSSDLPAAGGSIVRVYNQLGRDVVRARWDGDALRLPFGGVASGMYVVVVRKGSEECAYKVVKQ